ncbi:MAG TPA: hypothetical protein VM889_08285 [Candidatus Thermoplasmatota archaeon]|nr:hypothetical protein [Candidatus Thermoplasmatota archaeon]
MELHTRKKVEIVIDAAARERVLAIIREAGAKGYTIVPRVEGQGHRGLRSGHDIFDPARNVRITTVATQAVAERILRDVLVVLEKHAGIAYLSDVQVAGADYF